MICISFFIPLTCYRLCTPPCTLCTLFIRSYEQGERTYMAMHCRRYGRESPLHIQKKFVLTRDYAFLAVGLPVGICTTVLAWLLSPGLI